MTGDASPYSVALEQLGAADHSVIVLDAGLASSMQTSRYRNRFADRYVNLGIAEANVVGFASGLARRGYRPIVHSFSNFLARRAHDQIALSLALPNLPVILVGGSCGVFDGRNGPSHFAGDDLATFMALPNFQVFEPADAADLTWALTRANQTQGPSYIRLRRHGMQSHIGASSHRRPLRVVLSSEAETAATIIAIGSMLEETLTAAQILRDEGIGIDLFHLLRLKPLELSPIEESVRRSGFAILIENHVLTGGGAEAVARWLGPLGVRISIISLPDAFFPAGEPRWLLRELGLDATSLADRIFAELNAGGR